MGRKNSAMHVDTSRRHHRAHLRTLNREIINLAGQRLEKLITPTPTQRRVFELIGSPIPLTLSGK